MRNLIPLITLLGLTLLLAVSAPQDDIVKIDIETGTPTMLRIGFDGSVPESASYVITREGSETNEIEASSDGYTYSSKGDLGRPTHVKGGKYEYVLYVRDASDQDNQWQKGATYNLRMDASAGHDSVESRSVSLVPGDCLMPADSPLLAAPFAILLGAAYLVYSRR